ncbi:MAG: hypothetical protein IJR07_12025 [Bacteroidaceae bacterium]|nr:hypothetical protein [Bacteroidaceae bacterium]
MAKIANKDHQVVMREELSEEDLDEVVGGVRFNCKEFEAPNISNEPLKAWWFF